MANKTLCYHEENRHRKQGRTPWEAYSTDSQRWDEILQRVKRFKGPLARAKLERFQMHQIPDDFVNRQLSDTRYISKAATAYLAFLYGGRSDEHRQRIQTTKGPLTALVRAGLNLNRILGNSGDKTREDHRHHAIDAIVTALCGPGIVREFTRQAQRCEQTGTRFAPELEPPWPTFLHEVRDQIEGMIVSHRCTRRLAGPLHNDTNYAIRREIKPDGTVEEYAAHRKPLKDMSWHEVQRIIDPTVRRLVQEKLEQFGAGGRSEPSKCFKDANNHPYRRDKHGRIIPIHAARIRVGEKPKQVGSGPRKRYVVPRSNSHVEVFAVVDANGDTKCWEWRLVSRLEAYARYRANRPIVDRNHAPDRRFLFSLRRSEMVEMELDGVRNIYLVEGISHREVEFCLHNDARPISDRKDERVRCRRRRLMAAKARKVVVDPLGQVFPAND